MANVSHASLTGANLHEPKGVAAASANRVYLANGAGSGSWTTVPRAALSTDAKPSEVFLNKTTASASGSLSFNSTYLTSTYDIYKVVFQNLSPATNGAGLRMFLSTNNGSALITSGYYGGVYGEYFSNTSLSFLNNYSDGTYIGLSYSNTTDATHNVRNTSTIGVSGHVYIVVVSGELKNMWGHVSYFAASGTACVGLNVQAVYPGTGSLINYLSVSYSSGNIAAGSMSLYGVATS